MIGDWRVVRDVDRRKALGSGLPMAVAAAENAKDKRVLMSGQERQLSPLRA